ncbi:MAG: dipeptidase [Thermodesulfobacteriota bacterium]
MRALSKRFILDGHNDTLQAFFLPNQTERSFFEKTDIGHIDLPRAIMGGLAGAFFSIFVPSREDLLQVDYVNAGSIMKPVEFSYAREMTEKGIETLFGLEAESEGRLKVVRTVEELQSAFSEDRVSAIIHFEGAEALEPSLDSLEAFYAQGLRSIGIVWSRPNAFGYGVDMRVQGMPDQGPGLTPAGKELVKACNRLGILIDLSHLNERGFWDIERMSQAPLVATHSCAHALSPSPRNLTDRQLDAIGASGGVVGINFSVRFLREDGEEIPDTPLSALVRHFQYIAGRIGVDHLAMGSDFDGTTIPKEIGDVTGLPKLIEALHQSGFDEEALHKISFKNWLRVLSATWR